MLHKNIPIGWLLLILLFVPGRVWPALPIDEELHYRASYRGVFSAGAEVPIADVVMRSRLPSPRSAYAQTELLATSEAYPYVEALYPVRYRFRSWYWHDLSAVLASEYYEFGRPKDIDHKLIYLDRRDQPILARNLQHTGTTELALLQRGDYQPRVAAGERHAFDRLGLLQRIRMQKLEPGRRYDFIVTNGSKMLRYQVTVESAEQVSAAGREWPALKLRFDGLEQDRHGNEQHTHRPVFIWVSQEPRHTPLLAVSRSTLGRFRVELMQPPKVSRAQAAQSSFPSSSDR